MLAYKNNEWPEAKSGLVRSAQKLLLGPSGHKGVVLDWRVLMEADNGDVLSGVSHLELLKPRVAIAAHLGELGVKGDPNAKRLWPRGWTNGVGLAVLSSAIEGYGEEGYKPGVAYFNEDHWVAGMLPEGVDFGQTTIEDRDYRTVIARVGQDDPVIAPVMINPRDSRVYFPFTTDSLRTRSGIPSEEFIVMGGLALGELSATSTFADAPVV